MLKTASPKSAGVTLELYATQLPMKQQLTGFFFHFFFHCVEWVFIYKR